MLPVVYTEEYIHVFALSNKLSVLMSRLELEMGPRFADSWCGLEVSGEAGLVA